MFESEMLAAISLLGKVLSLDLLQQSHQHRVDPVSEVERVEYETEF
jgi:hypothetical protein